MSIRFYILFLFFFVQTYGQNYVLKEAEVRDKDNSYLIISSPFVDKDRFVWYASNKTGDFYRFDGKNKLKYSFYKDKNNSYDSYGLSNSAWAQDRHGTIWVAKPFEAFIIKPGEQKVDRIKYPKNNTDTNISTSIAIDGSGNMWISNQSSFLIKIGPDHKPIKVTHEKVKEKDSHLEIVKMLDNGKIIVRNGADLFYIDTTGLHFYGNLQEIDKEISLDYLLFENGKLAAKNTEGFYKFNDVPYKFTYIKELDIQIFSYPSQEDCSMKKCKWFRYNLYNDSELFMTDDASFFICQIDRNKNEITTIDSLHFKKNIAVNFNPKYPDLIWICTYDEVYKLLITPNPFKKILQFENKQLSTRGIQSDSKNNLYMGTYQGLYTQKEGQKKPQEVRLGKKMAHDIMILENDSILWTSGSYFEIKRINLNTNKIKYFRLPEGHEVSCMKEKSPDEFWLGTSKGLYVFHKKTGDFHPYVEDNFFLGAVAVNDLQVSKNGLLWIATSAGLFCKEKGHDFINYGSQNKSFNYQPILTLHEDGNGKLWMGTRGQGVVVLDPKTSLFKNYTLSKGLSNLIVCGILESKEALWFSTYYGLSRLDKKKEAFTVYYKEDGLPDNEFNLRSVYKKNNHAFYFGGLNGIIEFDPEKISFKEKQPHQIFLFSTSFFSKEQNKDITRFLDTHQTTLTLPYNKNYLSAKFSINELFYTEKNAYLYRIDGLTNGWINTGTSGSIELYGMPAGDYLLEVKGRDAKGIETSNTIKIRLHVEQVFFKTTAFISLLLLTLLGLIIYFFIRRSQKQKRVFEREKEIIELKASALKAQMNPHFVFNILNNMQSVLILKGEREVNKYFGAFSKLLRLTLDMSKQELVSFKDEIDYITNYLLLNQLQLNDELSYSIVIDKSIKDTTALFLPGMLLQPFVENAILHGLSSKKDKQLYIGCTIQNHYLVITIEDNGIGRAASLMASKNKKPHKSWATTIVNERIRILNDVHKDTVLLEINDLEKEGRAAGTQVILKFRVTENKS